ncbi:hypothetical protein [Achromobacter phage SE2]|nr:hypothetical protein [Achromobacter phage SE2]
MKMSLSASKKPRASVSSMLPSASKVVPKPIRSSMSCSSCLSQYRYCTSILEFKRNIMAKECNKVQVAHSHISLQTVTLFPCTFS